MSSARDITRAAWPPRAAYLDFPLGHTSGRPHQPELNTTILRDTLAAFESLGEPGSMAHLSYRWSDSDRWKDRVFASASGDDDQSDATADTSESEDDGSGYADDRVARHPTPQFQTDADEEAALTEHDGQECLVCAGIDY